METKQSDGACAPSFSSAELERAAFEHWYLDGGKWAKGLERSGDGTYRYAEANTAWRVWLARATLQVGRSGEYICAKCGLRQSVGMKDECAF